MTNEWIPLQSIQTPVLQQNLSYLTVMNKELLNVVQSSVPSNALLFQQQGTLIRCRTNESSPRWLFGKENPQEELNRLRTTIAEHIEKCDLLILLGNTIGYALAAAIPTLFQRPTFRILVLEPDAARLRACFTFIDLRAALDTGRLSFDIRSLTTEEIIASLHQHALFNAENPAVYVAPESECAVDQTSFLQKYKEESQRTHAKRLEQISHIKSRSIEKKPGTIRRILLIDCWPGAPGSAHIQAIHNALRQRSVESGIMTLNRYRIDAHEAEYKRIIEKSLLDMLERFQPEMVISYGYHAPKLAAEEIYQATNIHWIQTVSNIAYYDTNYFPSEHTALIDRGLIPYFERRGAPHAFFIPLMADYVSNRPTPTSRKIPLVFVGNSLGLSSPAVDEFRKRWEGRNELLRYVQEAENELSAFDRQNNLYDYLDAHPVPQIQSEEEEYAVFRYLLCQASAARRRALLEKIAPLGLGVWGGDWMGYLPKNSVLQSCLKGHLPMQEEPKIFHHGHIFVNIQSIGHVTGPNMRFFNVPGMGGFQISDGNFSHYLEKDRETVYYTSEKEFLEKVQYYLHHPQEADEIRSKAHERIRRDWTYHRWFDWLCEELNVTLG